MREIIPVEGVVTDLLDIAKIDKDLSFKIRAAFTLIAKKPHIGTLMSENLRLYSDPGQEFRVSYNSNPDGAEVEILKIYL